jgi:hypothetical protein
MRSWTTFGPQSFACNDTTVEAAIPLAVLGLSPGRQILPGCLRINSTTDRRSAIAARSVVLR